MTTYLIAAAMVDVEAARLVRHAGVVIEAGRIVRAGPRAEAGAPPKAADAIDLGGLTLLPGLVDCHVHLAWEGQPDPKADTLREEPTLAAYRAARSARRTLDGGVTLVRDTGAPHRVNVSVARAVEQGMVEGPRVIACASPIAMTGGHGWWMAREVDGPFEARKGVREQLKAGAGGVKIMASGGAYTEREGIHEAQLTPEEVRAAVEEAHAGGVRVAAHAVNARAIRTAVEAGVDTVEHGPFLDEELTALIKAKGTWLVPTVAPYQTMAELGTAAGVPAYAVEKSREVMAVYVDTVRRAFEAGVRVALGTDAGSPALPHPAVHVEAALWAERAGVPPGQVLRAATLGGAAALGLAGRAGSLAAGGWADVIAVDGNPLDDIRALGRVRFVMKGGRVVRRVAS
jgi:imidazolonepropionase-like amidohydrolase